jgi:hypothetical protein
MLFLRIIIVMMIYLNYFSHPFAPNLRMSMLSHFLPNLDMSCNFTMMYYLNNTTTLILTEGGKNA